MRRMSFLENTPSPMRSPANLWHQIPLLIKMRGQCLTSTAPGFDLIAASIPGYPSISLSWPRAQPSCRRYCRQCVRLWPRRDGPWWPPDLVSEVHQQSWCTVPFYFIALALQHTTQMSEWCVVPYVLRIAGYEAMLNHVVDAFWHNAPGATALLALPASLEPTICGHSTTSQLVGPNEGPSSGSMVIIENSYFYARWVWTILTFAR